MTIEGTTFPLPQPFMVIATQVETHSEGTYPLADVQSDRFLLRVTSNYSSKEEENEILERINGISHLSLKAVIDIDTILRLREKDSSTFVSPEIRQYIVTIIDTLRADQDISLGPSTRASIATFVCARALAMLEGRDYVIPDDIKNIAGFTIEHRITLKPEAEMEGFSPSAVLKKTLDRIPVPRLQI